MKNEQADLEVRTAAVLTNYAKQLAGTTVLLAISGGADSVSLLYTSAHLQDQFGFSLRCVHVNHRLRPSNETGADAYLIKHHCKKLKVPLTIVNIAPGAIEAYAKEHRVGIEAAARYYRHRAFKRQIHRWSASWIFLGHTRDDALELALMRFLRGSGPMGLAQLPEKRGRIIRPLITSSRKDVEAYLFRYSIPFANDSTNEDNRYLRNRIRNVLIPLLDREFPFWRSGVFEAASTQTFVAALLKESVSNGVSWEKIAEGSNQGFRTESAAFFHQPMIIREESMYQVLDKLRRDSGVLLKEGMNPDGETSPRLRTVRRTALRQFAAGKVKALNLSDCRFIHTGLFIEILQKQNLAAEAGFSHVIRSPGQFSIENLEFSITNGNAAVSGGNRQRITLPCLVRLPQMGDRLRYRNRLRSLAELRTLSTDRAWVKQFIIEDTQGLAVYVLIDIHSKISIYWRDPIPETVEKNDSFMLEIQLRGNHARRSER
ncbi:MAG: tRNA lysidine(34) synthetase TilS [Treponema sp.]|nr:tRNA lysidine(34) synthetase TilS [Treponema sp.]